MQEFTIIIPFFNGHATIGKLIQDIPKSIPILIIDDLSDSPLAPYKQKNIRLIRMEKKGYFTGAVNRGIQECSTNVLIVNQDARLNGDGWQTVIATYEKEFAMLGERIKGDHPAWEKAYIHGTFMWLRRDLIKKVGLLNEVDYPLWGSTCEYQLRAARAGFKVLPMMRIAGFQHEHGGQFGHGIRTLLKREPERYNLLIRTPPEISVIIPCHNYGRYVKEAVNSLIGGETSLGYRPPQTFQSFEIIIVNDGSTDNSKELCNELADQWKGIRVVHLDRQYGTAIANNAGIEKSHGKYITILSADDMREPDSLEYLYRALTSSPHSFSYDNVMPFAEGELREDMKIGVSAYDFEKLIYKNHVHAGIMFPKKAWEEVKGYPQVFKDGREDWAFNVGIGIKGYCGIYVDRKGYLYRREGQNRSLRNTNPRARETFLAKMMATYPELYKGERPMGCCGGKSKNVTGTAGTKAPLKGVAMDKGSIILEYIGTSYGTQTFYGVVSGSQYTAGKNKPIIQADPRDVYTGSNRKPGLLELRESGKAVFKKYSPPKPIQPIAVEKVEPVEEEKVETASAAEPIVVEVKTKKLLKEVKAKLAEPTEPIEPTVKKRSPRKKST